MQTQRHWFPICVTLILGILSINLSWSHAQTNPPKKASQPKPGNEPKAKPDPKLLEQGLTVLRNRACLTCHSINGSRLTGPSLYKLYGKKREVLVGKKWRVVVADEAYIRRSILQPRAELVKGYEAILMPQLKLTPQEVTAIVATIQHLKAGSSSGTEKSGSSSYYMILWFGLFVLSIPLGIALLAKRKENLL